MSTHQHKNICRVVSCWALLLCGSSAFSDQGAINKPTSDAINISTDTSVDMGISVSGQYFGILEDGRAIEQYRLKSPNLEVQVMTYGGAITQILMPDNQGRWQDIVLGFDGLEAYENRNRYFGSIIGRYANKVPFGQADIAGNQYKLSQNRPPHHLHGGSPGFDAVVWEAQTEVKDRTAYVHLHYLSEDGEQGYPGNLHVKVSYGLSAEDTLTIEYQATTDQTTLVNLTNHSYFNLSGQAANSIEDHILRVSADQYVPLDKTGLSTGIATPVEDTPFDFRKPGALQSALDSTHSQIDIAKGIDHYFLFQNQQDEVIELFHPQSGRAVEVNSTAPGVQIYSGNYLSEKVVGKNNQAYSKQGGICLETGEYPASLAPQMLPIFILQPEETYRSTTRYRFFSRS